MLSHSVNKSTGKERKNMNILKNYQMKEEAKNRRKRENERNNERGRDGLTHSDAESDAECCHSQSQTAEFHGVRIKPFLGQKGTLFSRNTNRHLSQPTPSDLCHV